MPKTKPVFTNAEAVRMKESGLTWPEIGKHFSISAEAARTRVRDCRIRKSAVAKLGKKEAIEVVLGEYGLKRAEFDAIMAGSKHRVTPAKLLKHAATKTKSIRFAVLSDTHIGHHKFHEDLFASFVKDAKDADIILHPGDHLEGMSGRAGHVYELAHIGYQAQFGRAVELYRLFNGRPMYGIDGNHDQWFKQKADQGIIVGQNLEKSVDGYTHLGEWEGDLKIDGLWVKLFHANDGTAYANSYKGQKLVESLSGGQKPHIIFEGHYHKSLYQFTRNVHMFESGTICKQSGWMRGKKLAAHIGYWLVTVRWNEKGVERIEPTFVPGYE